MSQESLGIPTTKAVQTGASIDRYTQEYCKVCVLDQPYAGDAHVQSSRLPSLIAHVYNSMRGNIHIPHLAIRMTLCTNKYGKTILDVAI